MNLYKIQENINQAINKGIIVDQETGEVLDFSCKELQLLKDNRDTKIENIAIYIKNNIASIEALKNEKNNLEKRLDQYQKKTDFLKKYLSIFCIENNIKKIEYPKASISFRTSQQVEINSDFNNSDFIRIKQEVDKQKLKEALKGGLEISGAKLIEKQNIQIK